MRIGVRLFAGLREAAGWGERQLQAPTGATPRSLWRELVGAGALPGGDGAAWTEAIVAAGIRATAAGADALFISCTALRASEAVERIEQAIGRPVVTSNQAVVWHALHLMQLAAPTQAPGRLFDATRVR